MRAKTSPDHQPTFLFPTLSEQCDPRHPLRKLSDRIPWGSFEEAFADHYSTEGRPAKPVRLMVGLLLLKQMHSESEESVVERWKENPYWQQFCGMVDFQWDLPCDPSDLVYFRHRIGEAGVALILAVSAQMHGQRAKEAEVVVAAVAHETNQNDGHTLPEVLDQAEAITNRRAKVAIVDRGYRGRKMVGETEILVPGKPPVGQSRSQNAKMRARFRRRAAIEPVISHIKHDFRLLRCFLKGFEGDQINLMRAAAAWNLRKWMRDVSSFWLNILRTYLGSFALQLPNRAP